MFQIACSGHSTNSTPNTSASNTNTSVVRRRYQPAATIATPARSHIHHGNHNDGDVRLPLASYATPTPRTMPSMVCSIGPGSGIQLGSLNEPRGTSFVYRMLCVYDCWPTSGISHTAGSANATAPIAAASGRVRNGRRTNHNRMAATPMKMATTMWHMTAAAMRIAGSHRRRPVSSV